MKKSINTKKYIEEYVKIRNKNSKITYIFINQYKLKSYGI